MNISKVALAVSTVFLLSACGGDSQEASDKDTDTDNTTQPETEVTVDLSTLSGCLDSLAGFPVNPAKGISGRVDARLYQVSRLNHGDDEKTVYKQSEIDVGERVGLPNGLLADTNVKVTQITIANPDLEPDAWSPSFEHSYVNADNQQYLGQHDVFSRWWSTNVDSTQPMNLNLDETTQYWIERVDQFSPEQPVRHENLYATYKGKETIETAFGEKETCVVEYSSELALMNTSLDEPVEAVRIVESSTDYLDQDYSILLSVREYSEYDPADLETATWGYSDYRKELIGRVKDEVLIGADPEQHLVPEGGFTTMEQCLASLPDNDYIAAPDAQIEYLMTRSKGEAESMIVQDATYTLTPRVEEGVSWRDHENLNTTRLHGAFFDYQNPTAPPFYEFTETYYSTEEGVLMGFEATENGGNVTAWGADNVLSESQSATSGYLLPDVRLNHGKLLNATAELDNFVQVMSTVFAGVGTAWDSELGEFVPACKEYRRWEANYYTEDGAVAVDGEGNPVVEFSDERNFYDNRGLIESFRTTHNWDSEGWLRMMIN